MRARLFLIIFILLLFSFGVFKTALAQDCENVHCTPCTDHWDCRGNTGPNNPVAWDPTTGPSVPGVVYGGADPKVNCGGRNERDQRASWWHMQDHCDCECCAEEDCEWHLHEYCASWESCGWGGRDVVNDSGTKMGHPCYCDGPNCVLPPEKPRYYDNPLYPQVSPTVTTTPDNIYLPVKLDWEDIQGWDTTGHYLNNEDNNILWRSPDWCLPAPSPDGSVDCVKSYLITIYNSTEGILALIKAMPKSEFNYREPRPLGEAPCFLKSNRNYSWTATACCSVDGGNCSPATSSAPWVFYTNAAPEPIGTYDKRGILTEDPDWNGENMAKNVPLPETVRWCTTSDRLLYEKTYVWAPSTHPDAIKEPSDTSWHVFRPHSWNFWLSYIAEPNVTSVTTTNINYCYPILVNNGKCTPETIIAVSSQLVPPAEFVDNNTSSGALFAGYHYLSKLTSYGWQVAACRERAGSVFNYTGPSQPPLNEDGCTDYSQYWKFSVANFNIGTPKLEWPAEGATVGVPTSIRWIGNRGTISSKYEVRKNGGGIIAQGVSHTGEVSLEVPPLTLNTDYTWMAWACWDWEGAKCEATPLVAHFRTGGSEFNCVSPPDGATNVSVPVELKWKPVPWAQGYIVEAVEGTAGPSVVYPEVVYSTSIYLNYPDVQMGQQYSWHVLPCQDKDGLVCGQNVPRCSFTTMILGAVNPATLFPANGETVYSANMPINISWGAVPGAKYYKYSIYYVSKPPDEVGNCNPDPANPVITNLFSATMDNINLACLGNYEWEIQTCLNVACTGTGGVVTSRFSVVQGFSGGGGGGGGGGIGSLVPCGRVIDDPNTPWNERDQCEIKHIFLLVKIIIDFLLWKLGIILLIILVALSGAIYYFSMGSLEAVSQVKLIWRAAGIGYGILFLGWLIINIFLMLFGYNVGIFGPWYQFRI